MAERRSLTTAVISPVPGVATETVRAFVTQSPIPEQRTTAFEPKPAIKVGTTEPPESESLTTRTDRTRADGAPNKKVSRLRPVGLIPITVRLRPEIAGALKRASLERELEGEDVFTQQDIVEQALVPYLKRAGFLD